MFRSIELSRYQNRVIVCSICTNWANSFFFRPELNWTIQKVWAVPHPRKCNTVNLIYKANKFVHLIDSLFKFAILSAGRQAGGWTDRQLFSPRAWTTTTYGVVHCSWTNFNERPKSAHLHTINEQFTQHKPATTFSAQSKWIRKYCRTWPPNEKTLTHKKNRILTLILSYPLQQLPCSFLVLF